MTEFSGAPFAGAVRVVVVDAQREAVALEAVSPDGSRWSGVWVVVRAEGDPVGLVELSFGDRDRIPAAEIGGVVARAVDAATPRGAQVADDALPRASVVVPTDLGRPDQLRTCVAGLLRMDHPDFEVVVVDNHRGPERDGLLEQVLAGLAGVRIVRQAVPGISAARNAGAGAARGEVLAFTDDDVRVDPGWLRALCARFVLRPGEDVVTGLILPADLETQAQLWFERHYGGFGGQRTFAPRTYRGQGSAGSLAGRARITAVDWAGSEVGNLPVYGAGVIGAGANFAVRADTLRRAGGFDLSLGVGTPARGGEDLALFIRHLWRGGTIGFEPAAMVFHSHRADYEGLRRQLFNYGLGYTALLSALVTSDPRHLVGIASQLPAWRRRSREPVRLHDGALPPELRVLERTGALRGPGAYAHSRLTLRARRRLGDPPSRTPRTHGD